MPESWYCETCQNWGYERMCKYCGNTRAEQRKANEAHNRRVFDRQASAKNEKEG